MSMHMTLFGFMTLGPGLRSFGHEACLWSHLWSCSLFMLLTGTSAASCVEAPHPWYPGSIMVASMAEEQC